MAYITPGRPGGEAAGTPGAVRDPHRPQWKGGHGGRTIRKSGRLGSESLPPGQNSAPLRNRSVVFCAYYGCTRRGGGLRAKASWMELPQNRFLRGIYLLVQRYLRHNVGMQGAALAFYLLFMIFPLLIFISSLLGLLQLKRGRDPGGAGKFPAPGGGVLHRGLPHLCREGTPA